MATESPHEQIKRAYRAGKRAAKRGVSVRMCPHALTRLRVPSMVRQAWMRGHMASTAGQTSCPNDETSERAPSAPKL